MKRVLLALSLLPYLATAADAQEIKAGDLVILHPNVENAVKGQEIARGSLTIRNEGKDGDKLLSVSADFAETATINGPTPTDVPAGAEVPVRIVYEGIKSKLSEDKVYRGKLVFERAGRVRVEVTVTAPDQ